MELEKFRENGGHAFVVGLQFCFPPRYAMFDVSHPDGWVWTSDLTEAETFSTKEDAEYGMWNDMVGLIDGNKDVKVLKVELKVGPA